MIYSATGSIKSITNACLQDLITIFQGYKNITEAAYCQVRFLITQLMNVVVSSDFFSREGNSFYIVHYNVYFVG